LEEHPDYKFRPRKNKVVNRNKEKYPNNVNKSQYQQQSPVESTGVRNTSPMSAVQQAVANREFYQVSQNGYIPNGYMMHDPSSGSPYHQSTQHISYS
jgi:hypothetical protein